MRPLLTRGVFRRILHNELYKGYQAWTQPTAYCLRAQLPAPLPTIPKRCLFGFSRKPKRQPKPINFDPGLEAMFVLDERLTNGERLPPPEELSKAFIELFRAKQAKATPLEDIQVQLSLKTFEHLQTCYDVEGFGLGSGDLRMALKMLRFTRKNGSKGRYSYMRAKLARLVFEELKRRREAGLDEEGPSASLEKDVTRYIQVLSQYGSALKARDVLDKYWESCLKDSSHVTKSPTKMPWAVVLRGLIKEQRSNELQKTLDMMEERDLPFTAEIHQIITVYYAINAGDFDMALKWYEHPITSRGSPTTHTDASILKMCIMKNELQRGEPIFKALLERNPEDKGSWDTIFQWAAAKGRSVDEVEKMMEVMIRRSTERGDRLDPDMETINGLVELATSKDDSYTAERYVSLGQKLGFQPNVRTDLLQMDYRIKVGDLGGARSAHARLQGQDVPRNEDWPLINKLIVALCGEERLEYDAIMSLVEDLSERKARFEPETVIALSLLHLKRGETEDLVDLLSTHTFQYSIAERATVRQVLKDYCLDPSISTSAAWNTYDVIRSLYTETDVPARTELMESFFQRQRSDMATHVFGHMRQQQIMSMRPTTLTYAKCLTGIAKLGDRDSLDIVHNMMKLDTQIEPDTKLYSALMFAFSTCGRSNQALDFWQDIVHSREGPTYASIQIALRACEKSPYGEETARNIWGKLKRFEIEVTREIYAAYVGAFAGHNMFDKCVLLVDNAEKDVRFKPDALM